MGHGNHNFFYAHGVTIVEILSFQCSDFAQIQNNCRNDFTINFFFTNKDNDSIYLNENDDDKKIIETYMHFIHFLYLLIGCLYFYQAIFLTSLVSVRSQK